MKISILGCGWLGLPLADSLLGKGHLVMGSTTRPEKLDLLREHGVEPFLIRLDPEIVCRDCDRFWNTDLLVLNIPPDRKRKDLQVRLPAQVRAVLGAAGRHPLRQLIFISSTSVYPSVSGTVTESDAIPGRAGSAAGNALLKAEQVLIGYDGLATPIIRFGGLYGAGRHPVRYLTGREGLEHGKSPVNLIHLDDCIGIIERVIDRESGTDIFNGVTDRHPSREQCYREVARRMGLPPPVFVPDSGTGYKTVSNRKVRTTLQYRFLHTDPATYGGDR